MQFIARLKDDTSNDGIFASFTGVRLFQCNMCSVFTVGSKHTTAQQILKELQKRAPQSIKQVQAITIAMLNCQEAHFMSGSPRFRATRLHLSRLQPLVVGGCRLSINLDFMTNIE
jgi:hypothetical protein